MLTLCANLRSGLMVYMGERRVAAIQILQSDL
jgi:hypothetical protein